MKEKTMHSLYALYREYVDNLSSEDRQAALDKLYNIIKEDFEDEPKK